MTLDLFRREKADAPEWREVHKGTRALIELADRHYTRQSVGAPGCCRPGVNFCLVLSDGSAAWVVWRPIPEVGRMDNFECWENTLFRNEGRVLSSALVASATALTFRRWGWPPRDGLITAIGVDQTNKRRSPRSLPGKCFREAGWTEFVHPSSPPHPRVWLRAPHPLKTSRPDANRQA